MINKKNLLGKQPAELGIKDAIHTAIVSVRAACPINPGQRCGLNEHREAIPSKTGFGVADPFLKEKIQTGQWFWILMDLHEAPNVIHVWEHPTLDFSPPDKEPTRNKTITRFAKNFGVSYDELMDACTLLVKRYRNTPYPGIKTREEVDEETYCMYELWHEWASEVGYEFYNQGTECCPEYDYPIGSIFTWN